MKKVIAALVLLAGGLTRCAALDSDGGTEVKVVDSSNISRVAYEEADAENMELQLMEYVFQLPENAAKAGYCVTDDLIYYGVEYSDYLLDQESGMDIAFDNQYNTQIRAYHKDTGEDTLIYQYDSDWCVHISDICCFDDVLIWEEYGEGWKINSLILDEENARPKTVLEQDMDQDSLWTVTPMITDNKIYWYNITDDDPDFALFQYDLRSGETTKIQTGLYLASPYEQILLLNHFFAFYEVTEDGYQISMMNTDKNEMILLQTEIPVAAPVYDGKVCVWRTGYGVQDEIYIYDRDKDTLETIELLDDIHSFGVIDKKILINYRDRMFCYDTETKTYAELVSDETAAYLHTNQGGPSRVYFEVSDGTEGVKIMEIMQ